MLDKKIPVLSLDSPTFADDLAGALGIQPGEKIQFIVPQFERTDGVVVPHPDFSPQDWSDLPKRDKATLRAMGLGIWEDDEKGIHWLFPKEWYSIIPSGLQVLDIFGHTETFERGVTGDDIRFGCLAYGFMQKSEVKNNDAVPTGEVNV